MTHLGRATRPVASGGRSLSFELLERRDLLAVIRLASWNTANFPNAPEDSDFSAILAAIGQETVQGNTKPIDILALQETDFVPAGSNSIGNVTNILNNLYPAADYVSQHSSEDGGGDVTGFVYDTTTVSLVDLPIDVPGTLTHTILRAKFRPSGTLGESDFYVYSVHLKSGAAGMDEGTRGMEATVLRADADSLGDGVNVLMVGDFNMHTSTEVAYVNLTSAGAGQVQDVAAAPGDWFNNPAFKHLHSQDPGASMDDRFDIHFASGEFFDDLGLDYVDGSFHAFGNNGTHTLGQQITTGTALTADLRNSLAAASDHLPVVADYEVIPSTPNVRITETGGGTKVIEGGLYDTYYVVLDTMPTANVTVTVSPDAQIDVGNGAGVSRPLTFTTANWQTPQVVIVRAANDAFGEATHTGSITHTSASVDMDYNALSIASVTATILDNDAPTIVINEVDADTPGADTMEFVELYDGGVGNSSLNGMTLVLFNGDTDLAYSAIPLAGRFTDANGFFVLGNVAVPGVNLGISNNTLQNGADAVALYAGGFSVGQSVTTVNLLDAIVYDNSHADDPGLLVLLEAGQPQVNENENAAGQTHSLSRVPDGGAPRQTASYVAQAPTPDAVNQQPLGGALFVHSGTRVDVAEGGVTDSYQIALTTIPTSNVTVTVDPDAQTNLGAGAGVTIMLTFTPANALTPQFVTVTAVNDVLVEGTHTSIITHTASSSDSGYNGLNLGSVTANVLDNDFAVPPTMVITEIMYNPATSETGASLPEWIEVVNAGTQAVDMGGWKFDDEDSTNWGDIPFGTVLNPGQIAVFFDSEFTTAAAFRTEWTVPASALVVGVSWGSLANDPDGMATMPPDENLQLLNASAAQMDLVHYDNGNSWPSIASSPGGPSIYLKALTLDNNVGGNWARSAANTARSVSPSGPTFSTSDIGSPGRFFLPGDYNVNGFVDAGDYVLWREGDLRADGSGPLVGTPNGVVDQTDYDFWRANFGNVGAYYGGVSAAAAGEAVASSASSAASSSAVAVVSQTVKAAPVPVVAVVASDEGKLVAHAAVVDLGFLPQQEVNGSGDAGGTSLLGHGSPVVESASVDLLLVLEEDAFRSQINDREDVTVSESADLDVAGLDEFFASLVEWKADLSGVER